MAEKTMFAYWKKWFMAEQNVEPKLEGFDLTTHLEKKRSWCGTVLESNWAFRL